MQSANQPSHPSNAVSRPLGPCAQPAQPHPTTRRSASPVRVPVRRMPGLLRQLGCTTRAFIKLNRSPMGSFLVNVAILQDRIRKV